MVGLWCHWKYKSEFSCSLIQRNQDFQITLKLQSIPQLSLCFTEHIYDEPSLSNPNNHEMNVSNTLMSGAQIEMTGNVSYASLTVIADSELTVCPAYVRHLDIN